MNEFEKLQAKLEADAEAANQATVERWQRDMTVEAAAKATDLGPDHPAGEDTELRSVEAFDRVVGRESQPVVEMPMANLGHVGISTQIEQPSGSATILPFRR